MGMAFKVDDRLTRLQIMVPQNTVRAPAKTPAVSEIEASDGAAMPLQYMMALPRCAVPYA